MNLTLSFNGITKTLPPIDVDGKVMFDLNEIWRGWSLPDSKRPRSWRGKERESFERCTNLYSVNGDGGKTVATQPAVYAYAMWVSTEFFMAVVQCFTHVVNGDLAAAAEVAEEVAIVDIHAAMLRARPRNPIRKYLDQHPTFTDGVRGILAAMSCNSKATRTDRERFTQSLREEIEARFDVERTSASRIDLVPLCADVDAALRLVAEKERYWARTAATLNNGGY